jgi:Fe-S-cluster containining protein
MDFPCVKCGICCRTLQHIPALADFDRGNGICHYLKDDLCAIYDKRPAICNIREMYNMLFQAVMTEEEFVIENLNSCMLLARSFNNSCAEKQIKSTLNEIIDKCIKVNL